MLKNANQHYDDIRVVVVDARPSGPGAFFFFCILIIKLGGHMAERSKALGFC